MAFASGLNIVVLVGTITTDIKAIEKDGQVKGCRFMIGVNRRPIQNPKQPNAQPTQQTDYIPCTAWGWTAKRILDKYQKRSPITVHGTWQSGSYMDRNGNKVYTNTCVIGEVFDFMNGSAAGADNQRPAVTSDPVADILGVSDSGAGSYPEIDPDDLPF